MNAIREGFTLIEVMITVAIIAILASIAYPSYLHHVQAVRREEAKRTLVEAAQHMEAYYALHLSYAGSVTAGAPLGFQLSDEFSQYYALQLTLPNQGQYKLSASPLSGAAQASDACGVLTISSTGQTDAAQGGCW